MSGIKKRIARFNRLLVNVGSEDVPSYVVVKGLSKIEMPITQTEVDVSDFDSGGWDDSATTHRGWSVNIEGFDGYTGPDNAQIDDPGQAHLKAKGLLTGPEAYTQVRMYRTDTNKGYEGRVTVNWNGIGADLKAAEPFKCALKGSGQLSPFTYTP